jgi:hypothetical protein
LQPESELKYVGKNPQLIIELARTVPVITITGDDSDEKQTMIAATLTVELNKLGRNCLFCYFDEVGILQSKHTTAESVDLMVVVCCEPPNKTMLKLLYISSLRLLLTFDVPFGVSHAYSVLKNNQKSIYEHIIVNFNASDDGRNVHDKLLSLMELNQLTKNVSYLADLTIDIEQFQCSDLISFANETTQQHNSIARNILSLLEI